MKSAKRPNGRIFGGRCLMGNHVGTLAEHDFGGRGWRPQESALKPIAVLGLENRTSSLGQRRRRTGGGWQECALPATLGLGSISIHVASDSGKSHLIRISLGDFPRSPPWACSVN